MSDLTEIVACKYHPMERHPHRCRALRLKRRLQRAGYQASQYQGVVKTDAPSKWAREQFAQIINA